MYIICLISSKGSNKCVWLLIDSNSCSSGVDNARVVYCNAKLI